jgi:hypothetical protein
MGSGLTAKTGVLGGVLSLGQSAIRINFDRDALVRRAFERLYLSQTITVPVIGDIDYVLDDTVSSLIERSSPTNAVLIDRPVDDPKRFVLNLKVFNEFTVSLARAENRITVRYPSRAPITYLLDDVLQAAVQPFLEELGGFILHGSCLVKNGIGLALMGNSGSGKSTTAFNLVRAGYHCYADDAIIVTPKGTALYAWPFSREMSIRPLSFQLLQSQGLTFSGYRQEGKKYYFKQPDVPQNTGARLRCACLIEVGGEQDTEVRPLSRDEFLDKLLGEQRYFSFVNREHHGRYAEVVMEHVPEAVAIHLGQDLNKQIQVFDSLVDPSVPRPIRSAAGKPGGRAANMELIRTAWRSPGAEPLRELIPLLANSDLKIFKNALTFFQNFPLAQLEPGSVESGARGRNVFQNDSGSTSWLRVPEWVDGCQRLIETTCQAAYDQYATGWFRSAPILYAFLNPLIEPESAEHRAIFDAWSRYLDDTSATESVPLPVVILTGDDTLDSVSGLGRRSRPWVHLSGRNSSEWSAVFSQMASAGSDPRLIVMPVFAEAKPDLNVIMACMHTAHACGLKPRLARSMPLCWLDEKSAAFLLGHGGFLPPRETPSTESVLDILNAQTGVFERDRYVWVHGVCNGRGVCHPQSLGLCCGGYFARQSALRAGIVEGIRMR